MAEDKPDGISIEELQALEDELQPVFLAAVKGNFTGSEDIEVEEVETPLTSLKAGIKILIHGINEQLEELEQTNAQLILANKQLEATVRKLEEFTYISSHDLRAPMVNLKMLMEFKDRAKDIETRDQLNEKIKICVNQLESTLNDLISIISGSADKQQFAEVMIEKVVQKALKTHQNTSVDVTADLVGLAGAKIHYEKGHLTSLFNNLISNSIKYCKPENKVHIKIECQMVPGGLKIIYSDDGLGLDLPEENDKLFGLFKRGHDHTEGKGLGMYMVKNNIEEADGFIIAKGRRGKGIEFTIKLRNKIGEQKT